MPNILSHHSSEVVKTLLIGDTGAGKTGAIASLCCDYRVFMLDLDNGVDILKGYLTDPKSPYLARNPNAAANLYYKTFTDPVKFINGQAYYSKAEAWAKAMECLMGWNDKDASGADVKFGPAHSWGPDTVLVIDSLSGLSQYALNYHQQMNGGLMKEPSPNEGRRHVGAVQNMLRRLLDMIKDSNLKCNVVLTAHVTFVNDIGDMPAQKDDGRREAGQGYPSAIGRALSPHIPRYFNTTLIAKTVGTNAHKLFTQSQFAGGQIINAKTSAPLGVKAEYPLSTGLADYFRDVKGAPK
jgi:hypothetical protein